MKFGREPEPTEDSPAHQGPGMPPPPGVSGYETVYGGSPQSPLYTTDDTIMRGGDAVAPGGGGGGGWDDPDDFMYAEYEEPEDPWWARTGVVTSVVVGSVVVLLGILGIVLLTGGDGQSSDNSVPGTLELDGASTTTSSISVGPTTLANSAIRQATVPMTFPQSVSTFAPIPPTAAPAPGQTAPSDPDVDIIIVENNFQVIDVSTTAPRPTVPTTVPRTTVPATVPAGRPTVPATTVPGNVTTSSPAARPTTAPVIDDLVTLPPSADTTEPAADTTEPAAEATDEAAESTVAESNEPEASEPGAPTTAAPSATVPPTTVPATTVPATTVPATTVPPTTMPPTTLPPTTLPPTTVAPPTLSALDVITQDPELSVFRGMLDQAGVAPQLGGPGGFTVFAPTNAVIDAIPNRDAALSDPTWVAHFVNAHIVLEPLDTVALGQRGSVTAGSGDVLPVTASAVNGAPISGPDRAATNGYVHTIAGVAFVPALTSPPA